MTHGYCMYHCNSGLTTCSLFYYICCMSDNEKLETVSVDAVIFGFDNEKLKVLLVKRIVDKPTDSWALPGGYVYVDEDIDVAAERILEERTGVKVYMKQLGAFGKANRFPDKRVITIAYFALARPDDFKLKLEDDASELKWIDVYNLPLLLLDHQQIIVTALESLRLKVRHEPIGFNMLPKDFPLLSLQRLYESILNKTFDKPNFRRKILKMDLLLPLDEKQSGTAYRSARLYKFNEQRYNEMKEKGFSFEV